jgi:histidinol-phosphate aminotransferase
MAGLAPPSPATPRIQKLSPLPPLSLAPLPAAIGPVRNLQLNEAPFAPTDRVIAAMQAAAATLNRYPDHDGRDLVLALSAHTDMPVDCIVVGAGTNELLFASAEIAIDPGDEAVVPEPGFSSYARSIATRGGVMIPVPVRTDGVVDVDAILAAIGPKTRLVFVASPHNPTGGLLTEIQIERFVRNMPPQVLLHFDEAYYEFGRHAGGPETLPILSKREGPWIATRSFSKAYGLAGARVGYGIASSPELAELYRRVRISFSINAMALAGARAALDEKQYLAEILDHAAKERKQLADALLLLGLRPLGSAANFLTVVVPIECPISAPCIVDALALQNIFVMQFPWPESRGAIRITIGTSEDTVAVSEALRRIIDLSR